jgi:hypothetical protein
MCYVVLLCRQIMIRVEVVVPYSAGDILSTVGSPLPHSSGSSYIVTPFNRAHDSIPLLSVCCQIHDRGCCDKVVYQADGTYVVAKVRLQHRSVSPLGPRFLASTG